MSFVTISMYLILIDLDAGRNPPQILVGVKEAPYRSSTGETKAAVCECPHCYSTFWFHISDKTARRIRERINQKT